MPGKLFLGVIDRVPELPLVGWLRPVAPGRDTSKNVGLEWFIRNTLGLSIYAEAQRRREFLRGLSRLRLYRPGLERILFTAPVDDDGLLYWHTDRPVHQAGFFVIADLLLIEAAPVSIRTYVFDRSFEQLTIDAIPNEILVWPVGQRAGKPPSLGINELPQV